MRLLKPKLVPPTAPLAGSQGQRWINACLDYLRTECHLAVNTIAAYRRDLTRFAEWLGGRAAAKLTVRALSDYMGWLQTKKLAATSIARHMVAVKLFYRYLQLEGVVRDNPAELLGTQKTWQRVPEVLSPALNYSPAPQVFGPNGELIAPPTAKSQASSDIEPGIIHHAACQAGEKVGPPRHGGLSPFAPRL